MKQVVGIGMIVVGLAGMVYSSVRMKKETDRMNEYFDAKINSIRRQTKATEESVKEMLKRQGSFEDKLNNLFKENKEVK